MKSYYLLGLILIFSNTIIASSTTACENLYSKSTYALSHTKKALKATNFEHQMYYAERALKMMEQAKGVIADCGCANSEEKNYQAIKSLANAIDPHDWEAGRFYSKKALAQIQELITSLEICSNETYEEPEEQQDLPSYEENPESSLIQLETQEKYDTLKASIEALLNSLILDENKLPSEEQKLIADKTKKLLDEALNKLQNSN